MKKVETVLTHLFSHPAYAKLKQQSCFGLIQKALPATLQKGILFMYVKNRTLFFALKHPGFKMEFDYKLSLIKSLLSSIPPLKEKCGEYDIDEVKAFVSKFAPKPQAMPPSVPRYKERASGTFDILSNDEKIRESFQKVQQIIQCKID